jgi:Holliday junction resolvasome RuvABC endonuclease subunit
LRIAGIDPDTHSITAFVVEEDGQSDQYLRLRYRFEAKGRRAEDRFLALVADLQKNLPSTFLATCDYIYVERPFVGPNRRAAIDVGMVVGALRAELERLGVPHSLVDPAVWKTNVLGTSRVSKEEIKAWAIVRFGLEDNLAQDYFDAACIAAYGLTRFTGGNGKRPR